MVDNQFLNIALFYASKGWKVFPITPRRKNPPLVEWRDQCSCDQLQIETWWHRIPNSNIGIACGESGLLVLDVDADKGGNESLMELVAEYGQLPDTVESITGGGGRHILFNLPTVPIGNSASKLGPGLDIRADGGYIVAPPSIHPNGKRYEWELSSLPSKVELADAPEWLLNLLLVDEPVTVGDNGHIAPEIPEEIHEGQRNHLLTSLAGTMRRRGMSLDAIYSALQVENDTKCSPPLSADEVMVIAKSITRYQPTAPVITNPHAEEIKTQEPLDAYGGVVAFLELLNHLEGRSINTHIERIDTAIGGLERQTLMVLAARPSMGKSTLAWQIARNVAASGKKALFFSLEMSITSLWAKAACGKVGTSWRDIRAGKASEATITRVIDSATELMEVYQERLLVNDHVNTTSNIWESVAIHRPDLVIVDHLRLINDHSDNEVQRLGAITKSLKDLAKELNCAVLCLAQLNRQVENRDQKRPQMADLRDSGQIEENADTILMLYRPDYYDDNQPCKPISETEILIRKFRDDINNQRIKLYFDTRHQWFLSELPGRELYYEE